MSDLTVALALDGEVTIETVAQSAGALHRLLIALQHEVGPTVNLEWVPAELKIGSLQSIYEARRLGDTTIDQAEQVIENYLELGTLLAQQKELPNAAEVVVAAERLVKHARASAEELVLGTPSGDAVIDLRTPQTRPMREPRKSIGSVTGCVQTLSGRSRLHFVLYQEWTDQPVRCYVQEHQAEELRAIWGRRARVRGILTRIPRTRRILSVRDVTAIETLPDQPPARFESARGTIQWRPQDPSPANFIREHRDAE